MGNDDLEGLEPYGYESDVSPQAIPTNTIHAAFSFVCALCNIIDYSTMGAYARDICVMGADYTLGGAKTCLSPCFS